MLRFIFICMAVVAVAILTTTAQFMINGIEKSKQVVTARNMAQPPAAAPVQEASVEPSATTLDEPMSADALNAIDTAAGGDDFKAGFSDVAPKGLEDDAPVLTPVPLNTLDSTTE